MNDSSLRILQPSLEGGGVIHPHFIDEKIEVQGPSDSGCTAGW